MSSTANGIAGAVVAVALLSGAIALRRYVAVSQPPSPTVLPPTPRKIVPPRRSQPMDAGDELIDGSAPEAIQAEQPAANAVQPLQSTPVRSANQTPSARAAVAEATRAGATGGGRPVSLRMDGSTPSPDQPVPLIQQGLELDTREGATLFPPDAVLALPDAGGIDSDAGTIAMWVRREGDPNGPKSRSLIELVTGAWENRLELGMGPQNIRFLLTTSDGSENAVNAGIDWVPGDWHHLAATWGEALMTIYVDGAVQQQRTYTGSLAMPPGTPLYVASSRRGPAPDTGPVSLRGFVVLQHSAPADEIGALMSETAPSP